MVGAKSASFWRELKRPATDARCGGESSREKCTHAHLGMGQGFTDSLNAKETRAHTHRELIREWLWGAKGSSLEYI